MDNKKIHFAVVGQGHIGKRHAEMIRRNSQAVLIGLCDIKPANDLFSVLPEEPFYQSINELLENHPETEVVNICTPNGSHAELAIKALRSGKHVVIEKPMSLTVSDAENIIHESLKAGKKVFCVMQNRYSPPSVWLKNIVSSGVLGKIYMVQLNCFWNRDERYYTGKNWKGTRDLDGGTLFTQFSHWVDIMYWIFGDIKDIQAHFDDFNHQKLTEFEDSGMVIFRFNDGAMGSISYSTSVYDKNLESSLTIIAQNGSVKVGGQYMDKIEYCHIKNYTMPELPPTNAANDYGGYKGSANNHDRVIQNVIDTLKGGDSINTNAMEGLKVVDIIQRIYQLRPEHLVNKKLHHHVSVS
jgi:predicted dehydrogenase